MCMILCVIGFTKRLKQITTLALRYLKPLGMTQQEYLVVSSGAHCQRVRNPLCHENISPGQMLRIGSN